MTEIGPHSQALVHGQEPGNEANHGGVLVVYMPSCTVLHSG